MLLIASLLLALLLFPGFLCGQVKFEDLYVSGNVSFEDGTPPHEPVRVELTCKGRVEQMTYTRTDGYFKLRAALKGDRPQAIGQKFADRYHYDLDACDLSAVLPGFTSTRIALGRRGIYQKESAGTIVLLPEQTESPGLISVEALAAPKEAMEAYRQAKEKLEQEQPKFDDVIKALRKAVELYPKFATAWNLLGESYIRAGDLDQARLALTAAIRLDSQYVQPCIALAFLELKQGRMVEALTVSEKALAIMPDLAEARFYHASAHAALGNLRDAENSLRVALASPDIEYLPRVYFLLGSILAEEGRFSEAARHFDRYIDLEPDSKAAAAASGQLKQWKREGFLD